MRISRVLRGSSETEFRTSIVSVEPRQTMSNDVKQHQTLFDRLGIFALAAILFVPYLGGVHLFDWDEINFAECAREMVETDNYLRVQINHQPFWEKPPLFFWMQAAAMQLFGVGEYAARLPNALCGIVTLQLLYGWGFTLRGRRFGWWWAGAYAGSILPHFYFKSGIIDPWFNLFIFSGLWLLWRAALRRDERFDGTRKANVAGLLLAAGALTGLGILTKGPVALLLTFLVLVGVWAYHCFRWFLNLKHGLIYLSTVVLVPGCWFGLEWAQNGPWFTQTFVEYQIRLLTTEDAGHGGFPGYHLVILVLGCFPVSWWLLGVARSIWAARRREPVYDFAVWMGILALVVLVLFSLVQSKIVHYSSLAYFPITFLGALAMHDFSERLRETRWVRVALLVSGGLLALLPIVLPFLGQHPELIEPLFAKDEFARGNLEADIRWTGWESLVGFGFFGAVLYGFAKWRTQTRRAAVVLLVGTGLLVQGIFYGFIQNIEGYSQRAALEFYESLEDKDVYVQPVGFKSYAHLFYTKRTPDYPERAKDQDWLLTGELDRPAYFVVRRQRDADRLLKYSGMEKVGTKNGFHFLKRTER